RDKLVTGVQTCALPISNFVYDAWVYLTDSAANIGNLEMDLNQTMPNGQTVIFGFQCDGYTGTWDYNANWTGPDHPTNTWMHSAEIGRASCRERMESEER